MNYLQIASDLPKHWLDPGHAYKPLDFGNGLLAGSVAPDGRLLSLNTYHPEHGYVTLSAVAPCADDRRYNQAAVRAYRADLATPAAPTFGLHLPTREALPAPELYLLAGAIPHSRLHHSLNIEVTTWAPHRDGQALAGAYQQWHFTNPNEHAIAWEYAWEGSLSLSRASYTQLTESGDLPMPSPALRLAFDRRELSIIAPELGAAAVILGLPPGSPWQQQGDGPLPVQSNARLTLAPGQTAVLTFIITLGQTLDQARHRASQLAQTNADDNLADTLKTRQKRSTLTLSSPTNPLAHSPTRPLAHSPPFSNAPTPTSWTAALYRLTKESAC